MADAVAWRTGRRDGVNGDGKPAPGDFSVRVGEAEGTAGGVTHVQVGSAPSVPHRWHQPQEFQTRLCSSRFFFFASFAVINNSSQH